VSVTLRFSVSYWTRWGQSVIVTIGHASEGSRRHGLNCRHQGDDLIWEGDVQVPSTTEALAYSYAIVDEAAEIEAEEISKRSLALPEGLADGSTIELRDTWQVGPSLLQTLVSFVQLLVLAPGGPPSWAVDMHPVKQHCRCSAGHIAPSLSVVQQRFQRQHSWASQMRLKQCTSTRTGAG
jgi:hypothetical protein